jgi:Siphovirus Gp157
MKIELLHLSSDSDLEQLNAVIEQSEPELEKSEQLIDRIVLRRQGESITKHGQRVDRLIDYIKFLGDTNEIDARITELQALKKSRTNLAKRLTELIKFRLNLNQVTKLETPRHKLSIVTKGGIQPIEIDYDEVEDLDLIPQEFIREKVTRTIDKTAIVKYLEKGNFLGWARLIERDTRLNIK